MLDIKVIRQDPERVKAAMKSRNKDMDKEIDEILEIDVERRAINAAVDNMKAEQNRVSKLIPQYKKEGKVFGIGCKIFTIAGPVILYGIFFSWIIGLIYWIISLM